MGFYLLFSNLEYDQELFKTQKLDHSFTETHNTTTVKTMTKDKFNSRNFCNNTDCTDQLPNKNNLNKKVFVTQNVERLVNSSTLKIQFINNYFAT